MKEVVPEKEQLPPQGCIPDAETAKAIAEVIWLHIYSKSYLEDKKPFHAELMNDSVWVLHGAPPPEGSKGGSGPYMVISKKNAQVYKIDQYK